MTTDDDQYRLAVRRSFSARHYLTVPDPGPEGDPHAHDYELEVEFSGPRLGEFGYLVDIDDVHALLDDIENEFAGALLNDREEFRERNPSVERFATVLADRVADRFDRSPATAVEVRLWEDADAWASYRRSLSDPEP